MKNPLLFTTFLALSSGVMAADIDYSRCGGPLGFSGRFDNDGKLQPASGMSITSQKTEGKTETYVLEGTLNNPYGGFGGAMAGYGGGAMGGFGGGIGLGGPYGGQTFKSKTEIKIERDDEGRIVKMTSGGDKVDPAYVEQMKGMYSGLNFSGHSEPSVWVNSNNQPHIVPVSKLTQDQAKEIGYEGDWNEIKRLQGQWKKDKKSLGKIQNGYAELLKNAPVSIMLGEQDEFDFQDGACVLKNKGQRFYNSKTKEVSVVQGMSREQCNEVGTLYTKYQRQISDCSSSQQTIMTDLFQNHPDLLRSVGGYSSFKPTTKKSGILNPQDQALGSNPGYGLMGGVIGGYGLGGDSSSMLAGLQGTCQWTYGVQPSNVKYSGSTSGSGSGQSSTGTPR